MWAEISNEIKSLTGQWEPKLLSLSEEMITGRKNLQNRNIRQITGHLVDSASNNIHRVVHLQYQPSPLVFPNYATYGNNDRWIAIQNYNGEEWSLLVQHWKYSMLHYCHVIENVNEEKLNNEWMAGDNRKITLREMIMDFPHHFRLHLEEINSLINSI